MENSLTSDSHQLISLTQKHKILSDEVVFLQACLNYTTFNLISGKKVVAASTLKHFENLFPSRHFIRINRSTLLNKAFVKRVLPNKVIMHNDDEILVSRRRMQYVHENF
jgi:two-component system, LytTR family, response regulator